MILVLCIENDMRSIVQLFAEYNKLSVFICSVVFQYVYTYKCHEFEIVFKVEVVPQERSLRIHSVASQTTVSLFFSMTPSSPVLRANVPGQWLVTCLSYLTDRTDLCCRMNLQEQVDTLKVQVSQDSASIYELRTCLEQEKEGEFLPYPPQGLVSVTSIKLQI